MPTRTNMALNKKYPKLTLVAKPVFVHWWMKLITPNHNQIQKKPKSANIL